MLRVARKAELCIVGVVVVYAAIGMVLSLIQVYGNAVPVGFE